MDKMPDWIEDIYFCYFLDIKWIFNENLIWSSEYKMFLTANTKGKPLGKLIHIIKNNDE